MSETRTPMSGGFLSELRRLETVELGETGVPGALFLGASSAPAVVNTDPLVPSLLGDISPTAALAAARERIERDASTIDAWSYVASEEADAEAAAAEHLDCGGALRGVPVGVKDVFDVAGMPTTGGSLYLTGERARVPAVDAAAVALLRAAGAVVVGKTRTHEFAFGGTTPPTRNPHDLDRIPGGSSGGSAAAVAAGHVRVALGSDTAGSVRIPASYCGVAGLVPSPGLLPFTGGLPLAWSMDRAGVQAGGPADLVAACHALGVVADVDPDATFAGVRIGVPRGTFEGPIQPEVVEAVQQALASAEDAGAILVDVDVPHQWAAVSAGLTVILGEAADEHRARRADAPELLGPDVLHQLELADRITAATYVRAQRLRGLLRAELLTALSGVDLLATPTMPCVAPTVVDATTGELEVAGRRLGLADAHLRYNVGANLAALPAGTQPVPRSAGALPIGMEWVAAPGADRKILEVMLAMERAWG